MGWAGRCTYCFYELYDAVIQALQTASMTCDSNTASNASQLTAATTSFTILISMCVASNLLNYTKPFSVVLQTAGLDMCNAMTEVASVQKVLTEHRKNANEHFDSGFEMAKELANKHGVQPSIPRIRIKQTVRANVRCENANDYFRTTTYVPFLDHLSQGLSDRFGNIQQQIAMASKLVPSVLTGCQPMTPGELKNILQAFPMCHPHSFSSEYERWRQKWQSENAKPAECTSFTMAYIAADEVLFPDIHTIVVPVVHLPNKNR